MKDLTPGSLRGQLAALVLAAVAPIAALLGWNLYAEAEREAEHARADVLQLAEATAAQAAAFLGQADNILKGLAARPALRALDPARCDPILDDFLKLAPRFANALTLTLDARLVCSAVPFAGPARADPELLARVVRGPRQLTVGRPRQGPITGKWIVPLTRPLLDAGGRVAGAVVLTLDLATFPLLQGREALPHGALVSLVAADGTILARTQDAARFVGTKVDTRRPAFAGGPGTAQVDGLDGIPRIQGFAPVPGSDWIAVASLPAAQVYAPARARLVQSALTALATLAAALLLAAGVARRLREPIAALAGTAAEVAGGNRAVRAPVGGAREIAEVAGQLNRMLDIFASAEAQLRASEARFRTVFMDASVAMSIRSGHTGALIDVNEAFGELFGYPRAELVGRNTRQLGLWVDPAEQDEITARIERGEQVRGFETRRRLRSGEVRTVEVNAKRIELDGEPCVLASLVDVTERKRAERERTAALERFQKIFHAAPLASSITTLDGARLVEVNAAFCALAGRKREELIGRPVPELGLWVDLRERDAYVARLRRDGRAVSFEARIRSAAGGQRTLLGSAEVIDFLDQPCIMMVGADITERVRAEQALREAEARQRQVLDNMFPFVGLFSLDGRVLEANRAPLEAAGLAREDVIGKPCAETWWFAYSAEVQERLRAALARAAAGEKVRYDETIRIAGGRFMAIDLMFSPLRDAAGRVELIVGSAADITERKAAEMRRQAVTKQLGRLSRRLIEVEETERRAFSRELHDRIGQNLATLSLNLKLVRRDVKEAAPAPVLARIDGAQALLEATTREARNLMADLHPPALGDYGLYAALRAHVETFAARTGLRVEVAGADLEPGLAPAVELALFRIAQEALANFAKHAACERAVVTLAAGAGRVALSVADEGRGFDPHGLREGASWGLAIMRERAAAAGIDLRIDAAPGQGTRITVTAERREKAEKEKGVRTLFPEAAA